MSSSLFRSRIGSFALALVAFSATVPAFAATETLVKPATVIIDHSLPKAQVAAQIHKREDGYYIGMGDRAPKVNGQPIGGTTRLHDGDIIEIGRVRLHFAYRA